MAQMKTSSMPLQRGRDDLSSLSGDISTQEEGQRPHHIRRNFGVAALVLIGTFFFGVFIIAIFASAESWAQTRELLAILLPLVTLTVGLTAGYYFGRTR